MHDFSVSVCYHDLTLLISLCCCETETRGDMDADAATSARPPV